MRVVELDREHRYLVREHEEENGGYATDEDFCACPRGRESLRWWREGALMPEGIGELFEEIAPCRACSPMSGLLFNSGWTTKGGVVIMWEPSVPVRFPREELSYYIQQLTTGG